MTNETLHAIGKVLEKDKRDCPNFPIHVGGQMLKLLKTVGKLAKYLDVEKYGKNKIVLRKSIDNILINLIAVALRMLENNK